MAIAEQYEHAGLAVDICYDENPSYYRGDTEGHGTIVAWGDGLGDETIPEPEFGSIKEGIAFFRSQWNALVMLPLYENGKSLTTDAHSNPLDGLTGFIFATELMIREWSGTTLGENGENNGKLPPMTVTVEEIEKQLRAEVDEYDQWLRGDVYGYIVHSTDQRVEDESCWGIIGSKYVKEEANIAADSMAEYIAKLPPSPYEVIVRETASGRETVVVADVEPILHKDGLFIEREIAIGIAGLKGKA